MLHFPFKTTEKVELHSSLYNAVAEAYSRAQADSHREAFDTMNQLRERVRALGSAATEKTAHEAIRLLARYHRLLTAFRSRFGLESSFLDVEQWPSFIWHDAFQTKQTLAQPDLSFETACVLFNLTAALSFAATCENRNTPTGLRGACLAFQYAAGAIDLLTPLANSASWAEAAGDLHPKAVLAWRHVFLAQVRGVCARVTSTHHSISRHLSHHLHLQAQQCFYEKACSDQVAANSYRRFPDRSLLACSMRLSLRNPVVLLVRSDEASGRREACRTGVRRPHGISSQSNSG